MKLKKNITLVFVLVVVTSFAQKNTGDRKAKRVAFITQFLELTTDESKAFWPVYEEKIKTLKGQIKPIRKANMQDRKKLEKMSDSEVIELINSTMQIRQIQLTIDKDYNAKFLQILPPKKVAKLYHIEKRFRQKSKKGNKGKRK